MSKYDLQYIWYILIYRDYYGFLDTKQKYVTKIVIIRWDECHSKGLCQEPGKHGEESV